MIKIEINSHDVTGYLFYEDTISWNLMRGQTGTANLPFIVRGSDPGPSFSLLDLIYIYEINGDTLAETCVWFGVITNLSINWFGNDGTHEIVVTGSSAEYLFSAKQVDPVTVNYANMNAGDIVTALHTLAAIPSVGLGTIDDGPIILSIAVTVISDAYNTLQTDAGFIWYVDPADQKLYFQAPGARAAAWVLTSDKMLWETVKWSQSYSDYRSTQLARAPAAEIPQPSTIASPVPPETNLVWGIIPGDAGYFQSPVGVLATQAYGYGVLTALPAPGDTIAFGVDAWPFGVSGIFTFVAASPGANQVLIGGDVGITIANLVAAFNASAFAAAYNLQSAARTAPAGWAIEVWATIPGTPAGDAGNLSITMGQPAQSCPNFAWGAVALTPPAGGPAATPPLGQQIVWNAGAGQYVAVPPIPNGQQWYIMNPYKAAGPWLGTANDIAYSLPYSAVAQLAASITPTSAPVTQQSTLTSALTADGLQQEIAGILARYSNIPQQAEFQTDLPGLTIGRLLTIALDPAYPPGAAARLNGSWYIIEVQATLLPGMDQQREPFGHFRYTVSLINSLDIGTFVDFWSNLANVGGSPGTAASGAASVAPTGSAGVGAAGVVYQRTLIITDTTPGTDIAPVVTVFQGGSAWRVLAVLRAPITADLVVRFNLSGTTSPPTTAWSEEFTIPAATPPLEVLEFLLGSGSPLISPQFEDQDVITADIVSSDGSKNANGVATLTLCWFG